MNIFTRNVCRMLHGTTKTLTARGWKSAWLDLAGKRSASSLDISGIHPPIPTPFNEDETIAFDQLEKNIKLWNKIPLSGYVVEGSNGEYTYLTPDERVEVVAKAAQWADKDKLIIAGSGCESTRDTIEMTRRMAEVGAHCVIVVTPCYFKARMTNDAYIHHYTQVADNSKVPVILYSVPGNTGVDLSPEVVVKLSSHPNIIGIKESGGDVTKMGNLVWRTRESGFQVLAGSASFLFPAYAVGCVGGVCAVANILGDEVCRLVQLFKDGKFDEARELQLRLISPNNAVTKMYGVAGLKKAMEWFGYYGGRTRSPLLPLTGDEESNIRDIFTKSQYL